MDMALDQTRTGEPAFGIIDICLRSKSALDRDYATVADANVRKLARRVVGKACIANDEIHHQLDSAATQA
jgi:hypothetical protein